MGSSQQLVTICILMFKSRSLVGYDCKVHVVASLRIVFMNRFLYGTEVYFVAS